MKVALSKQSKAGIKAHQEKAMIETLAYANQFSRYYQCLFSKNNIDVSSIQTLEELRQLPVTKKEDIHRHYKDFICVDPVKIIDYSSTSGTTGEPLVLPLTDADLERLAYNEAASLRCAGVTANDLVMLCTTMDKQFMAGLAYFLGIRKIGAGLIRAGIETPGMYWNNILRYKPTVLIAVPSFLAKLLDYAQNNNIDYQSANVEKIICIGENIRTENFSSNNLATRINQDWNVQLFSTYAATEMGAAFTECFHQRGGHHRPELLIIELLDENNDPVLEGAVGELTITTLGVEAFPLIRYKTGDLVKLETSSCTCKRNTARISPVLGRKQQRMKLKGTTCYPPSISNVLNKEKDVLDYLMVIKKNKWGEDDLEVFLELNTPEKGLDQIKERLRSNLRISPKLSHKLIRDLRIRLNIHNNRKPVKLLDLRAENQANRIRLKKVSA